MVLKTYQGDEAVQEFPLNAGESFSDQQSRLAYAVQRGKHLYFHEDTLADERGDYAEWNVKVRYTDIRYFEDLGDWSADYNPPESWANSLPWNDGRPAAIYNRRISEGETTYELKYPWQEFATEGVCLALLEHGAFVPLRIPLEQFVKMYGMGDSETIQVIRPGESKPEPVQKSLFLAAGYYYKPEVRRFLWLSEEGLEKRLEDESGQVNTGLLSLMKTYRKSVAQDLLRALDSTERVALGTYPWLDGRQIFPRETGMGVYEVPVEAPAVYPLPAVAEPPQLSTELMDRGLLLDRYTDPVSGGSVQVWLRPGAVVRDLDGVETVLPSPELSVSGTDPLTVRYRAEGVLREVILEDRNTLLESLPAWIYEGPLTDLVLEEQTFSTDGYAILPAVSWMALRDGIEEEEDRALLIASYEQVDQEFRLRGGLTEEEFQAVLRILDEQIGQADSIFGVLPDLPDRQNRLVRLAESEYAGFLTAGSNLAGLFDSYSDGTATWYYPKSVLSGAEHARLLEAMTSWRRDVELFPCYERSADGESWHLREGLSSDQESEVRAVLDSLGLAVWTAVRRSIVYRSTDLFAVEETELPGGAEEISLAPTDGVARTVESTSVIRLPSFDAAGETVYLSLYLHIFDSGLDYSAMDLTAFPDEALYEDTLPVVPESFSGGVYGWYYGTWSGYYEWAEARLTDDPFSEDYEPPAPPKVPEGKSAPPPYFLAAEQNSSGEEPPIVATGRNGGERPVEEDAWIGTVSRYSDVLLEDTGQFTTVDYTFAMVIQGDQLLPTRNGGDTFHNIPRGSVQGSGGTLSSIRTSKAKSVDVNGGVSLGPLGVNFSSNSSESWQYQALMDLNGDRYPDLVQFPESGGQGFTILPGTGMGFGDPQDGSGLNSHITLFDTQVYGFGGSLGSGSGGLNIEYKNGKPRFAVANGASASLGVNGTAGYSVQQEGFVDVNGDGLPDQVRRSGSGSYSVALNLGGGTFAPAAGWNGGLDMQVLEGVAVLESSPKGISHSGTGSFGGSVGVSITAGVAGAGVSADYTGTVSQTYSQLMDVNGDGLPDQVGKEAGESFFRVRFNRGDQFGPEMRLYRPEWGENLQEVLKDAIATDLDQIYDSASVGYGNPMGMELEGIDELPGASDNPFAAAMDPYRVDDLLEYTSGVCYNFGASLTFNILFPLVALTFTPGVNGSSASTSTTLKFTDLDGDGLPDHVLKLPTEDFLRVKRNGLGMAGLLKRIQLPQGGSYELGYQRAGNTVDLPQSRWVLSMVTRDDGLAELAPDRGEHRITVEYSYEDGYYDRGEREFWGFGRVESRFADDSSRVVYYHNRDHYRRGMAGLTEIRGLVEGSEALMRENQSTISNLPVYSPGDEPVYFPALVWERNRSYEEGRTDRYLETERAYTYDEYGNVTILEDYGDTATGADDLEARIDYALLPGYLKQHPERIVVEDGAGNLLRQREGSYEERGNLTELRQWEDSEVYHSSLIDWDEWGNLRRITDPRGASLQWEYDPQVRQYGCESSGIVTPGRQF